MGQKTGWRIFPSKLIVAGFFTLAIATGLGIVAALCFSVARVL